MTQTPKEKQNINKVCVVGLGYIGLPTAAFIAAGGTSVLGVDVSQEKVDQINSGQVPFFEPDFEEMLQAVVTSGSLRASLSPEQADAYIVAVPTPFTEDHDIDISYIRSAAEAIAPFLRPGALVVLESTSPPGTTARMAEFIINVRPDLSLEAGKSNSIHIAHCPERVLPGRIMLEMASNDRIIGGLTRQAAELAQEMYAIFSNGALLLTEAKTAEMAKLTENSFRDVNIAFANELSIICESLGIDVWELIRLSNHHPRVNILQPGPGVGGHCIAVDPWFIVSAAPSQARLIQTAREVNDSKPKLVVEKVLEQAKAIEAKSIAALGIAFKADIDDLRESPSLEIVKNLSDHLTSLKIQVVEPNITELPASLQNRKNVELSNLTSALETAELVLVLVDHTEFKNLDRSAIDGKTVIDTKGLFS